MISISQTARLPQARQISIVLTIVSLALWAYGITQSRLEIGKYGMIAGFSITYFLALGTLTVASALLWTSRMSEWKLLLTQLCLLLVSLFMAHLIVGATLPLGSVAYSDLGYSESILRTGITNPLKLWEQNWPGNYIMQAEALLLSGKNAVDFGAFLKWLPIIWQIILFFPVFVFLRNVLGERHPNYCWAGMWLFYLGNWFGLQYNGAQPFGIFCVFSVLALVSNKTIWERGLFSFAQRTSALLVIASLTVSHFLGSLYVLATLTGAYFSRVLKSPRLIVVAALMIGLWSMSGGTQFFVAGLSGFIAKALRLDEAVRQGIISPLSYSESRAAVASVRILFSAIIVGLGVLGAVLTFTKSLDEKRTSRSVLIISLVYGIAALIIGAGYNREIFLRLLLFLLPSIAFFAVKLLDYKTTSIVFVILLVAGLPLSFVSQHGNQKMDHISASYLDGANYFYQHTTRGTVDAFGPVGQSQNKENYSTPYTYQNLVQEGDRLVVASAIKNRPYYVVLSTHDRDYQDFFFNRPGLVDSLALSMARTSGWNLSFANPSFCVYVLVTGS